MVTEVSIHASQKPHYVVLGTLILVVPIITYLAFKSKNTKKYLTTTMSYMKQQSHNGIKGRLLFICFVVFMNLLFQDDTLPNLLSGQLFGFREGVFLTSVGSSISGIISFYIARYKFKDTVLSLINSNKTLQALKDSEDNFQTEDWYKLIALSRLPPVYPYHFISYFWGITKANPWVYAISSFIGVLPSICVETYIGTKLTNIRDIFHMNKGGKQIIITILISVCITIYIGEIAKREINTHSKVKDSTPTQNSSTSQE